MMPDLCRFHVTTELGMLPDLCPLHAKKTYSCRKTDQGMHTPAACMPVFSLSSCDSRSHLNRGLCSTALQQGDEQRLAPQSNAVVLFDGCSDLLSDFLSRLQQHGTHPIAPRSICCCKEALALTRLNERLRSCSFFFVGGGGVSADAACFAVCDLAARCSSSNDQVKKPVHPRSMTKHRAMHQLAPPGAEGC